MEEKTVVKQVMLGFEVEKVMKAKGIARNTLKDKLGMGLAALGSMLKKKDLHTERVRQLSEALGENLFALFLQEKPANEKMLTEEIDGQKKLLDEKDKKIAELEKELKLLREMIDVIKSLGRGK
ncbi:MAG: hypothetical protein JJE25_04490 [Bacteroidia bacterium]|nr:hypothetical protein [Bacteroidia bacterium]